MVPKYYLTDYLLVSKEKKKKEFYNGEIRSSPLTVTNSKMANFMHLLSVM